MESKILSPTKEDISPEETLKTLNREYLFLGRKHIKPWQAYLIIGVVVGTLAGVALVANRSGEVAPGRAATNSLQKKLLCLSITQSVLKQPLRNVRQKISL